MRCVFAYIACASVLMPIHALADWQYTKWGMSVEQAARASDGQLRAPTAPERSAQVVNGVAPGLVGTYRSATFNFKCALYFTSTPQERVAASGSSFGRRVIVRMLGSTQQRLENHSDSFAADDIEQNERGTARPLGAPLQL